MSEKCIMSLPLSTIRPRGWIRRQLEAQASGLSGHLDEFWPDIRDSGWIGGDAEGWERAPYWLDGLVPLAFLLGDEVLIAKVDRWIGYILDHQQDDGWLGPAVQERHRFHSERDPWPMFIMLKVLTQYAEARGESLPGSRTYDAIIRALEVINSHIDRTPLYSWNEYRWADLLVTILWCDERELNKARQEWLGTLAERIHNQGYDWDAHFERFPFGGKSDRWTFDRHVVNNAMGIKAPALWELYTTGRISADRVRAPIEMLDRHHGQATGMFSGDECFAGRMPSQGTELCAVVEYLFSLEQILLRNSDVAISDRLELIAFNALPAPFSPDMWAHQYDQQVNQVQCAVVEDNLYTTNRSDANLYGLEPHFGCCTANMHQGYPRLVSSLWVRTDDGGVRALTYLPCELTAQTSAGEMHIRVDGTYPWDETVEITVRGEKAGVSSMEFPLRLPILVWATGATIEIDDEPRRPLNHGAVETIYRDWSGTHHLRLNLPMSIRVVFRYNGAASVYRGPLLFALQPEEEWSVLRGDLPHADYEVRPASAWNLAIGLRSDESSFGLQAERYQSSGEAFTALGSATSAPGAGSGPASAEPLSAVRIPISVRDLPEWTIEHGAAAPPPQSPVRPGGDERTAYLVPYGLTGLRIAEIPWYWL